jgi:DNA (cytosine-5)-methyltransferase 1
MRYLDLFSGIGTASLAFEPLGWQCVAHAEVDRFASAVLAHRFPDVANLGDVTAYEGWPDLGSVDLVCGGSPCQSFSIAGLRKGLDDPRGGLMFAYLAIIRHYRPQWIIWENVPGVLSQDQGRAFETLLRGLEVSGYSAAWRVLDAQYVRVAGHARAVPQRRNRVFVVGYLGTDWRRPAQVLLEPESLRWNPAPRRASGQGYARPTASCLTGSGRGVERPGDSRGQDDIIAVPGVANGLTARMHKGVNTTMDEGQTMIAHALTAGMAASTNRMPSERGALIAFNARQDPVPADIPGSLDEDGYSQAVAFDSKRHGFGDDGATPAMRAMNFDGSHANAGGQLAVAQPLGAGDGARGWRNDLDQGAFVPTAYAVRRLTPRECERLQGLPDDWTNVPWRGRAHSPDGPRYRAIGNAWAVNVGRWVGERIQLVEDWGRGDV